MTRIRSARLSRRNVRRLAPESLEERALLASAPVQVVLMVGQSNMLGLGSTSDLRAPYDVPQSDVWIWRDDLGQNVGWTSLRGGFGGSDSNEGSGGNGDGFGPEVSLGRALENTLPDSQFALIKHVTGGTMQDGWNPDRGDGLGPGESWIDFMTKTHKALDSLAAQQLEYEVAGLIVSQGGSDINNLTGVEASNYQQNFTDFIAAVRQEFGVPPMPVAFMQVPDVRQFRDYDNWALVRTAQEAVDASDPLATMIQSDDLSRLADGGHFDAQGQINHGQRLANAFLGLPFEGSAKSGSDSFEAGGFNGGSEQWSGGAWNASGNVSIIAGNAPNTGAYHARLLSSTGELTRSVDVTELANVKLRFWSKLDSFEDGDKAFVKLSLDGVNWATLRAFVDGEDSNTYRFYEIDVPNLGPTLHVRFDAQMNQTEDFWYIDDVTVVGTTRAVPVAAPPTKFYIVDDAPADRTFDYSSVGAWVGDPTLAAGNAAPRGAASTAAGTRVWVVDANRNVYIYDNKGELQGLWSAGSLSTNSVVEGIATNGTDVWLVDDGANRVYRYSGAASRFSDSQNASSNFALNNGNKNPKDIVTDGAYLWVVDDSTTDKVFKYTVGGSLLGSWTISAGGGRPTGITLDPTNPNHLWIVDSATDRVYQYDNAIGRTSGSLAASTSFALAAGNTNPQGIADPPVSDGVAATVERNSFRSALPALSDGKPEEKRNEFRFTLSNAAVDQILGELPAPSRLNPTIDPSLLKAHIKPAAAIESQGATPNVAIPLPFDSTAWSLDDDADELSDSLLAVFADWK